MSVLTGVVVLVAFVATWTGLEVIEMVFGSRVAFGVAVVGLIVSAFLLWKLQP